MEIYRPHIQKIFYQDQVFFERVLPSEGEISCRVGDRVRPFDVLGSTFVSGEKRSWRISARDWDVLATDGQALNSGDVLARKRGWPFLKNEVLKMPFSGSVAIFVENDITRIDIASFPEKHNLVAGIEGRVDKIVEKRSVLLETKAYLISGVFGSGREVFGEIKVVGSFNSPLLLSQLTADLSGKVIVGGSYASTEVINKAQALGALAIVMGGLSLPSVRNTFPLLATEGFGRIPMNKDLWQFLGNRQLKTAVVVPTRRQMIVPGPEVEKRPSLRSLPQGRLRRGALVQVFVWPNFGHSGRVAELGATSSILPSGIKDYLAKVKLDDTGEIIEVPVSNLGLLE